MSDNDADLWGEDSDEEVKPTTNHEEVVKPTTNHEEAKPTTNIAQHQDKPDNSMLSGDDAAATATAEDGIDNLFEDEESAGLFPKIVKEVKKTTTRSDISLAPMKRISDKESASIVRMPNFVKIQTQAFDEVKHDPAKEANIYPRAAALIRWRHVGKSNNSKLMEDDKIESNARLVKFKDGTMKLMVGKEAFNVGFNPVSYSYAYGMHRSSADVDGNEASMECVGAVPTRMVLEPSSLHSEAHTKMSMQLSDEYKRTKRISKRDFESIEENPEMSVAMKVQMEERENRVRRKLLLQQNGDDDRYRSQSSSYGEKNKYIGMNSSYLEEEEEDPPTYPSRQEMINKRLSKKAAEDEEEESDFESSGSEQEEQDEEEDEEEEVIVTKKKSSFVASRVIGGDDEE